MKNAPSQLLISVDNLVCVYNRQREGVDTACLERRGLMVLLPLSPPSLCSHKARECLNGDRSLNQLKSRSCFFVTQNCKPPAPPPPVLYGRLQSKTVIEDRNNSHKGGAGQRSNSKAAHRDRRRTSGSPAAGPRRNGASLPRGKGGALQKHPSSSSSEIWSGAAAPPERTQVSS